MPGSVSIQKICSVPYGYGELLALLVYLTRQLSFERHRHAEVSAFVLGRGRRDDGADCVIVGNSGARGDVHRGRRGADEAEGDADDTIC